MNEKFHYRNTIHDSHKREITNPNLETMFLELVKQNNELRETLTMQSEKIVELAQQPTTIINNTQNNYNVLNFLNTEYKNAMTIDDFLQSINVTIED